jgi:hypothetical protein
LRLRSPVPRLGSISPASNSSSGDWRAVRTTYTIKIQTLKPDRSRATRTGQNSTQPQSVLLRACRNRGILLASASLLRSAVHYGHPGYTAER